MTQHNWAHIRNTSKNHLYRNALYICTGCGYGVYIYDEMPDTMTMRINYYWYRHKCYQYNIDQNCSTFRLQNLLL